MSRSRISQPTLKLCGANNYNQLGEESNNKQDNENFISPLVNLKLDVSNITSFSTYRDHTVFITKDGEIFGAGYNNDFRIIGSLPNKTIKTFTKFEIRDDEGQLYYPISAVCGKFYTLYMVTKTKDSKERKLAISYKNIKTKNPLFLNTENFNPFAIFGGDLRSVSIDEKGQLLYIPNSIRSHPSNRLITSKLPEGERAIDVAFFTSNVVILSSSGHVFISEVEIGDSEEEEKEEADQLLPIRSDSFGSSKIVEISGNSNHCIILSQEGKVWGIGENFSGSLGIEKKSNSQYMNFIEIKSLNNYVIEHVYSGFTHSLFQTKEGRILACGKNDFGQLCCKTDQIKNYTPIETDINKGAIFCVVGYKSSAIFINHDPLMNPNRTIKEKAEERDIELLDNFEEEEKENITDLLIKENRELRNIISNLMEKNSELIKENSDLKKENSELIKDKLNLEKEKAELTSYNESHPKTKSEQNNEFTIKENLKILDVKEVNDMAVIKTIGSGPRGNIFKVSRQQNFALKVLQFNESEIENADAIKFLQNTYCIHSVLNSLNHPNLIRSYGFCFGDNNNSPSILLELCEHNLKDIVADLEDEERVCMIVEICKGMEAMHSVNVAHCLLAPQSIFIDEYNHTRVGSFFQSCFVEQLNRHEFTYTQIYIAPEIVNETCDYTNKIDVYSFGTILYYILTHGQIPKISLPRLARGEKPPIPTSINKFSQDLINKCWSKDPSNRPSFTEIIALIKNNDFKLIDGVEKNSIDIQKFTSIK